MLVKRMTHTLLPRLVCSLGTLFLWVAWYILHPNSLCSSTHSTPWSTLLRSTLCSLKNFASWNTLLSGTLCCLEHFAPWNTGKTAASFGVKWSRELSVPKSNLCWGAKCFREQNVLSSKMFWWANYDSANCKVCPRTLLCEVTIDSICKCFVVFFHPHLLIKSKTSAYIPGICFRM